MNLFGIEVENKTSILALAAFLISLVSIGYSLRAFTRGASVVLFQPSSIIFAASRYEEGGEKFLVSIARFAYSNKGERGYSALVLNERILFSLDPEDTLDGKSDFVVQDWHAFVATTTESGVFELSSRIKPIFKSEAAPFVLEGGSSSSHETFLASRTDSCLNRADDCSEDPNRVTLEQFMDYFQSLGDDGGPRSIPFTVILEARTEGEGPFRRMKTRTRSCTVNVYVQDIEDLDTDSIGYFSRPCLEN